MRKPQFDTREFDICNANFNEYEILIFDSSIFRDGVDVGVFVVRVFFLSFFSQFSLLIVSSFLFLT